MFVVLEGYQELKIKDNDTDAVLNKDYIDRLRLFRNGSFHYQKEFYSEKIFKVDHEDKFVKWIYKIHNNLGAAILGQMKKELPEQKVNEMKKVIKDTIGVDI